jgi:hypothetical protein
VSVRTVLALAVAFALTSRVGLTQATAKSSLPADGEASVQTVLQDPLVACDYNSCALRLQIQKGSWTITRGQQATPVGRIGFRVPNVAALVATVPEAVTEARIFQSSYPRGGVLLVIGGIAALAGFKISGFNGDHPGAYAVGVAGTVLLFYGAHKHQLALNALNNAIWLYNRGLNKE